MLLEELNDPRVEKMTEFEQYLLQLWIDRMRDPYLRAMSHAQIRKQVRLALSAWDRAFLPTGAGEEAK